MSPRQGSLRHTALVQRPLCVLACRARYRVHLLKCLGGLGLARLRMQMTSTCLTPTSVCGPRLRLVSPSRRVQNMHLTHSSSKQLRYRDWREAGWSREHRQRREEHEAAAWV